MLPDGGSPTIKGERQINLSLVVMEGIATDATGLTLMRPGVCILTTGCVTPIRVCRPAIPIHMPAQYDIAFSVGDTILVLLSNGISNSTARLGGSGPATDGEDIPGRKYPPSSWTGRPAWPPSNGYGQHPVEAFPAIGDFIISICDCPYIVVTQQKNKPQTCRSYARLGFNRPAFPTDIYRMCGMPMHTLAKLQFALTKKRA